MKNLSLLFYFLFISLSLFSQNIETYVKKLKASPFEKLYLHTDREFYFEKDTLRFASYLIDGQKHKSKTDSCNLYVEIIDSIGKVVESEIFLSVNGYCSGWMDLSHSKKGIIYFVHILNI